MGNLSHWWRVNSVRTKCKAIITTWYYLIFDARSTENKTTYFFIIFWTNSTLNNYWITTKTCDLCCVALCVRNYPALLQIWPNLPDCFVGCFLCVNAKHPRKATCCFGKWFALLASKLPLKVYDARNTSVYHTLRLEFCTEFMLSLNMGLAGLSEITSMSEIRRLYLPRVRFGEESGFADIWLISGKAGSRTNTYVTILRVIALSGMRCACSWS